MGGMKNLIRRRMKRACRRVRVARRIGAIHLATIRTYVRNRVEYRAVANPYRLVWISPGRVRLQLRGGRHRLGPPGAILDGDWDRRVSPFNCSWKYRGLVERFQLGLEWEETGLFTERYRTEFEQSGRVMGFHSAEELARYYRERVDPLYESMRRDGFLPPSLSNRIDPVHIFIGRDGEPIWGPGGNHRLALAKILDLERIPVRVHFRHRRWQMIREEAAQEGIESVPAHLRGHEDLADLCGEADATSWTGPGSNNDRQDARPRNVA